MAEKYHIFLNQKLQYIYHPDFKQHEKPPAIKREHPTLQYIYQLGNRRFADFLPGSASRTFYIYGSRISTSKTSAIFKINSVRSSV
jgi:hypothetical protein